MTDLRTYMLMAGMTALFIVAGYVLGGHNGMLMALFMAVALNFFAYWNSDKMVLRMHNAYEVSPQESPEYYAIVQELARRANLPMPRVYIMDDSSPNAFATGRDPGHAAVAATTGLLRILNREELAGVMAHELAHVQHRDILISTIAATFAGAITTLANMAQWGALFGTSRSSNDEGGGGSGLGGVLMMLLAPFAAMLIQMAISRSREYGADRRGAELCGNPLWLASALDKLDAGGRRLPMWSAQNNPASSHLFIVNPLSGGFLAGLFSTHPPMEERIHLLQQMVPRP